MEKVGNISLYLADCMDVMKTFGDKEFDLAIVEKDDDYFNDAVKRLKTHQLQLQLF